MYTFPNEVILNFGIQVRITKYSESHSKVGIKGMWIYSKHRMK